MGKRKGQKRRKKSDKRKISYNFQPDVVWKAFFQQISNPERIRILNVLFTMDLPLDTEVEIGNTEDSSMNLFLGKPENSRADLIFDVKRKRKLHLEFQSAEDSTIGVRIFVYGLHSDTKREGNILHFPLSRILYTGELPIV